MELAQISKYYLKLTYSNLRLYIPGRTQGNTKPKHCHVVLKNMTDVIFQHRKAYIGTEELKHSPQKT